MRTKGSKNVTDNIERAIILAKMNRPNYSAQRLSIYLASNRRLYRLNKSDAIPSKRAINEIIRENSDKIEKQGNNPLDEPWRVASLARYPISPDALSIVLAINDQFIEWAGEEFEKNKKWPENDEMTIRQALWIARIYKAVEYYLPIAKKKYLEPHFYPHYSLTQEQIEYYRSLTVEDVTWIYACLFAENERIDEIEGEGASRPEIETHLRSDIFEEIDIPDEENKEGNQ